MEPRYQTLQTIYEIVRHDPQPHTYLCNPRDIILRQMLGWVSVQEHLDMLATEEFITMKQLDSLVICITPAGIDKVRSLKKHDPELMKNS